MIWNEHYRIAGQHALLSPSNYHWIFYDEEKLRRVWENKKAAERGTELHKFAHDCIRLGRKQPKNNDTVNMFVNDALHFNMQTEQALYFSEYCFGTADAICYEARKGKPVLRIFDLKTGDSPASMHQLEVYAALFFMEYGDVLGPNGNPNDTMIDLRIYQNGEVVMAEPDPNDICAIMDKIMAFDFQIRSYENGPGNDI